MNAEMNKPSACAGREDDVATYAVGALDGRDLELLESHLEGCDACSSYLEWLSPAVSSLVLTVPLHDPSPDLKSRIMSEVDAEVDANVAVAPATSESLAADRAASRNPGRKSWSGLFDWFPSATPRQVFGTALAATVLLLGVAVGISAISDSGPTPSVFEASPTETGTSGTLEIAGDSGTVSVSNLPDIESGRVFQMWTASGGEITAGDVFVADGANGATLSMDGLEGVEQVMVSEEPSGGSSAPTGDPILAFEITDA